MLARNTAWNLAGQGAPLVVALFSIPILIRSLGVDRFGVLTLAWVIIGYFSLFDLGLGRALTKLVAEKIGANQDKEIPALVWTALLITTAMGLLGAVVLGLPSGWLVRDILKIPEELQTETLHAFYLLALSVPIVVSTAGLSGILAAKQRFDLINAVRIPMGMFMYVGPLLVIPFSNSLFLVAAVLLAGRFITMLIQLLLCFRVIPALRREVKVKRSEVGPLIRFGSWMTVSNIISPLMVTLDRFLIGALISLNAVAYYATPYEAVTKLWLIPVSVVGVLFPAFAVSFVQDHEWLTFLFNRGVKYVFLILFPVTLLIVTLSREGLHLWLGDDFAENSTFLLQWLAVGVFVNSLAQVPFALIQGAGRPDITAKLHMIEAPVYFVALWLMIGRYGIDGAAIAWAGRTTVDGLLLFYVANRFLLTGKFTRRWKTALVTAAAFLLLFVGMLPMNIIVKAIYLAVVMIILILVVWYKVLSLEEKTLVQNRFRLGTSTKSKDA